MRRFLLVLILPLAAACSGGDASAPGVPAPEATTERPADAVPPARTLALPGASGLPQGHPPGDAARPAGLHWDVPSGWIEEAPASSMRLAQYRVDGPDGAGLCIVYYFGPGQGGDPMANAVRWARQFTQPDGSPSVDAMRFSPVEGAQVPVRLAEVTGTYDGGMSMTDAPAEPQPNAMLLGGIAEGADAPWFFKFTGPETTLRAQREAFVAMMRSIQHAE